MLGGLHAPEEIPDSVQRCGWVVVEKRVTAPGDELEFGAGDQPGESFGGCWCRLIEFTGEKEGRHPDQLPQPRRGIESLEGAGRGELAGSPHVIVDEVTALAAAAVGIG